jgi:hypothetical protein
VKDDAQDTTVTNAPDFATVYTGLLLAEREIIIFLLASDLVHQMAR